MIGLIVVTHADMAQGLLNAAFMIVGPQERALALCTQRDDQPEDIETNLKKMATNIGDDGDGLLVMTDMFGGTPTNISLSLLHSDRVEILTGVSLPMIIKFFSQRAKMTLPELVKMLKVYAQQGVIIVSQTITE